MGAAGIFSDPDIIVVGLARTAVVDDIPEDGSESNGVIDLELLFGRKVDTLSVASTLMLKALLSDQMCSPSPIS